MINPTQMMGMFGALDAQIARLHTEIARLTAALAERDAMLAEAREALRELIGTLEIASVMPRAVAKVYVPRMDAPELVRARAALATIRNAKGATDAPD